MIIPMRTYNVMKIRLGTFLFRTTVKALRGFFKYKLGIPNPVAAQWEITYNCNFKCKYCNVWRNKNNKVKELSLDKIKNIIDQLDRIGVIWITFTGGEPLLKKDFPEIIKYCNEKGIITAINDNGSLLKRKLPEIKDYLNSIGVSIDSHDERINDDIRGVKGSFKKALSSAIESKEYIRTVVNMTVTSKSLNSLEKMAVLCKRNGLKVAFTPVSIIPTEGYEKTCAKTVMVDPVKFYDIVLKLSKKYDNVVFFKPYMELIRDGGVSRSNFVCQTPKLMINLKPNGDVIYPCGYFPVKRFSAKKMSIKEIVKKSRGFVGKYFDFCDNCTLFCFLGPSLVINNVKEFRKFAKMI